LRVHSPRRKSDRWTSSFLLLTSDVRRTVPVVQRIEQGFPKGKTALLHKSADVITCAQIAVIEPVELLLGSSRVITNLHIFTHPGDTKGDTKLSTVFVSTQPMTALASSRGKQFAAQVSDEIADLRLALFVSRFRRG
jgi:hypothetical protein